MAALIESLADCIEVAGPGSLDSIQLTGIFALIVSLVQMYDEKHTARAEAKKNDVLTPCLHHIPFSSLFHSHSRTFSCQSQFLTNQPHLICFTGLR